MMKRTTLYEKHIALGAKMVDFGGWLMPVQYRGIIHEHTAVRNTLGIFDVSHMGRIAIEGPDAEKFLNFLSTNQITDKAPQTATYTVMCNEEGGSVDDTIIYKESPTNLFLIVNAANRDKDLNHLKTYSSNFNVTITPMYESEGILAIQGPKACEFIATLFPEVTEMQPMHFIHAKYPPHDIIIATTGYTGSGGVEIYAPNDAINTLWDKILEDGEKWGIEPVGLGARDTLRLEAGFALYGHELSDTISPIESIAKWTVKWNKEDFLGKKALESLKDKGNPRSQCSIALKEKGIPREGCKIFQGEQEIGTVTSGSFSPSLRKGIAIGLTNRTLKPGDPVEIAIRNHKINGEVVKLPFYKK